MKYGFGIDLGGTTVKIAYFDQNGTMLDKWEIPTVTAGGGVQILPDIAQSIQDYLGKNGIPRERILGIGIGVPGPVSGKGVVNRCVNLGWGVFNIADTLSGLTGFPVKAGNDANVAALGEFWKGGGQGCENMVFVTLGTGVGGGIVVEGRLLHGSHGSGAEIGHMVLRPQETERCGCGKRGCVEQYASANGIVRVTKERLAAIDTPSVLQEKSPLTCKDVFDAAKRGDAFAVDTLELVFDYLGEALASACCVADPERIILGGGVSKAGDYLLEGVERHFKLHMFHACKGTEFSLATLGNDAGMYGAFRLLAQV